jgi:hypothetical protein
MTQQQLFSQFTEGELATLKKAMDILGKLFSDAPLNTIKPNVQLHASTRNFLDYVQKEFGNEWIERKHPILQKIMREHYVKDLYTMLRQYDKHNLVEIVRNNNKNQNIAKFRFV